MPLTPEQFREAAARKRKTVEVEIEGVGAVKLRALSAGDAQRFQAEVRGAQVKDENGKPMLDEDGDPVVDEGVSFTLVARSWVDGNNGPWLPEAEGVELAKSLDPETFKTVLGEILKLNGLTKEAIKEAEKNSVEPGADSTPTGSQANSDTPTSI